MRILIPIFLCFPALLAATNCVNGAQTTAGYPLITAVCDVQWSAFTTSPPTGNEGNKYDIYYRTADGLGAGNKRPLELWLHGGGFIKTNNSQPSLWNAYFSQRATDGKIVIVPGYTVNTMFTLQATLNPSDTTATFSWTFFAALGCAAGFHPAGQTGVVLRVGTDTVTVTGAFPACDGSNHTVAVSRALPASTQASGLPMFIANITWPTMGQDIAGLLAFFAHCAPGGSSYNAGTCAGITNVAGDPKRISLWGISAGGQLATLLIEAGNCANGSTCTLLNTNTATPGGHEFSDTGWAIYNPGFAFPMVGASVSDLTGRTYPLSPTYQNYDTAMTAIAAPICTSGFDSTALTCVTPTATYTASLAQDALSLIEAGTPFGSFMLSQAGSLDVDFFKWEVLLGAKPGIINHTYTGQDHAIDYLGGHTPTTSTAFKEAQAVLGVNTCPQIANVSACPAPNPVVPGGIF